MKVLVVDYGMGNIKSIESTLRYLGVDDIIISSEYEDFVTSDKIILPGVGSFANAMKEIRNRNLNSIIKHSTGMLKKPILGICLGMQLMGKSSDEDGLNEGLGLVDSYVRKFDFKGIKVPHVGFNQVEINSNLKIFENFSSRDPDFYFTHSYRMLSDSNINQCYCSYGGAFVAAFEINNIAGVQFHPELSQFNGIKLFKNFIDNF
jgi:imidazole glycerol-phosphate synthase subunit HisH